MSSMPTYEVSFTIADTYTVRVQALTAKDAALIVRDNVESGELYSDCREFESWDLKRVGSVKRVDTY